MSRFDRFRTEQIRTERQFLNERNCFHRDTVPENLACHRLSLVILFIHQIKIFGWLFVLFTSFARTLKNRWCIFLKHPFQIKLNQNNTFFSGIINLLFDGLTYNTREHFCSLLAFFLTPVGLGKILRNSQNIRVYYMLNHRIRCMYCLYRSIFLYSFLSFLFLSLFSLNYLSFSSARLD